MTYLWPIHITDSVVWILRVATNTVWRSSFFFAKSKKNHLNTRISFDYMENEGESLCEREREEYKLTELKQK